MTRRYELNELTPKKTVEELNRYIIGQEEAKKAVAVALRNRYRRAQLSDEMKDEVTPKNIILMGPTGVGKTEITRRIAKLVNAPLVKVEATKFTEVGYVGRDVESMIRDLVSSAVRKAEQDMMEAVRPQAEAVADEMITDALAGLKRKKKDSGSSVSLGSILPQKKQVSTEEQEAKLRSRKEKREEIRKKLAAGELEDEQVTIEVEDKGSTSIGMAGMEDMNINVNEMFSGILPSKTKKRSMKVKDARRILVAQEGDRLIDKDEAVERGIRNAEQNGIVFIDEIDKIIGNSAGTQGPDVSREGVQRDILPIVEGSIVNTKYGPVRTDYILFIGSGAFHSAKVSDLIPELQGRFPINVELDSLSRKNFEEILTQTENSILKQYTALLETEGLELEFDNGAISRIAEIAFQQNELEENIGARRLHTVLEKLLEDLSFQAPDLDDKHVLIDRDYVDRVFGPVESEKQNYSKYLL
ncbi:MAG: ATP-dependent protease ATPase subunit HslU [Eubacteriaceae bacterium]|jgi:ATP-dependent HslUV protease ATP-binding subunit HslU